MVSHAHTHICFCNENFQDLFHTLENLHKFVQIFLPVLIKEPFLFYYIFYIFTF